VSALEYAGSFPCGIICALSLEVIASASASLLLALPPILVQLTAVIELGISLNLSLPNIGLNISALVSLIADLNAAISIGLPSLNFQLSACLTLILELGPIVVALEAAINALAAFSLNLGGIQSYSYSGTGAAFGSAMSSVTAGGFPDGTPPGANVYGIILAATAVDTWNAISSFFSGAISPEPGINYTGSLSLGEICVGLNVGLAAALDLIDFYFGAYKSQLSAALALQARLMITPPSISGSLSIALKMKASLEAYLTVGGFVLPSASIQAAADLAISIGKAVAALRLQISVLASLTATLGVTGVLAYTYNGPASGLGPAVTGLIGTGWGDGTPNNQPADALILVATTPAATAGMNVFFGGLAA
jgi:hypothetical protein